MITHWLSYGGGVNSTALAIALVDGMVPGVDRWRIVFADTKDEKDETYEYVDCVFRPWLRAYGHVLETVCAPEGVIERWERLSVTGSRLIRSCSVESKINPIKRYIAAMGDAADVQLLGIHAGESHRATERTGIRYPLVELDWGQEECLDAIKAAELPIPVKSGCWHCPFARRSEVIALSVSAPCKFERIVKLEDAANAKHGPQPDGTPRMQWSKPARQIRGGGALFEDAAKDLPCGCWDGEQTP